MLQTYGGWVVSGVTREKASRVVEVLLSTLTARQLMFGKIIGIGALALLHAATLVATAIVSAAIVGIDVPDGFRAADVLVGAAWFLLGYALYCSAFAAAGSLCSRAEDAQGAVLPIMLPLVAGYIIAFSAAGGTSPLLWVLAFFPPTAVQCMPVLYATGEAPVWAMLLSMAITAVSAYARRPSRRSDLLTFDPQGRQAGLVARRHRTLGSADRRGDRRVTADLDEAPAAGVDHPGQPGRGATGDRRGNGSPNRSPSVSAPVDMTSPMRLRRTTAVQWPYIVRNESGRPAATTVTSGAARRPGRRAGRRRRRHARRRRRRRGRAAAPPPTAATIDSSSTATTTAAAAIDALTQATTGEFVRGQCSTTTPSRVRIAPAGDETDQRRAATAPRRTDDEDVFAVGHLETGRRQRGEVDADRQRRRPVTVGGQRERPGVDVVAERADRHRRLAAAAAGPAGGSGSTASCASRRASVSTTRPGIGGGTAAARTPSAAHSIGSSTWNSQRWVSAANAAWATPPGRSSVATVWIPAATPSASTRSSRA